LFFYTPQKHNEPIQGLHHEFEGGPWVNALESGGRGGGGGQFSENTNNLKKVGGA